MLEKIWYSKQTIGVPKILKMEVPYDSAVLWLDINPKENETSTLKSPLDIFFRSSIHNR